MMSGANTSPSTEMTTTSFGRGARLLKTLSLRKVILSCCFLAGVVELSTFASFSKKQGIGTSRQTETSNAPDGLLPERDLRTNTHHRTLTAAGTVTEHKQQQRTAEAVTSSIQAAPEVVKDTRPTFVLHIGPHKTGTTYLQTVMCANHKIAQTALQKDKMVYLGTCGGGAAQYRKWYLEHSRQTFFRDTSGDLFDIVKPSWNESTTLEPAVLKARFVKRVRKLREQNQNAMLIFEGFTFLTDDKIRALKRFLRKDWKVKIVLVYRPLYEWLPSVYSQMQYASYRRWQSTWPTPEDRQDSFYRHFDLENRGIFTEFFHNIERLQQHPLQVVRKNYGAHFGMESISVVPLDWLSRKRGKVDPLLEYLMCTVLQDTTPNTCELVREGKMTSSLTNPSGKTAMDRLLLHAHEHGMLKPPDGLKRRNAGLQTNERLKRLGQVLEDPTQFSYECLPDETLQRLYRLSLTTETRVFPSRNADAVQKEHKEGFRKLKDKRKFCYLDAEKVMADPEWQSFYQRLSSTTS